MRYGCEHFSFVSTVGLFQAESAGKGRDGAGTAQIGERTFAEGRSSVIYLMLEPQIN